MKNLTEISLLIDFYGKLLTDKQLNYLICYYFDDFSLGEIAEDNSISKNAVYDSIKKSINELKKYESKLGFIEKYLKRIDLYAKIEDIKLKEELFETEVVNYGK